LNTLRDTKTAFLTPKRYEEQLSPFYMKDPHQANYSSYPFYSFYVHIKQSTGCESRLSVDCCYSLITADPKHYLYISHHLIFPLREHKDRALMSLAAVLHHANHTLDSIVLLHTAMDTCEEYSVYHFLLGNLYAVSASFFSFPFFPYVCITFDAQSFSRLIDKTILIKCL